MVVPLKLTQFYGHKVPRPRIYPDVQFNDQRVDPPPSVNDALLSWASDAHWSMGGLSFKRFRTQGKVEGNVRRLRALTEEDEDKSGADILKGPVRVVKKPISALEDVKLPSRKEASRSGRKRKHPEEEELVEATPASKLRRRGVVEESDDDDLPPFVPATEERSQRRGQAKSVSAAVRSPLREYVVGNLSEAPRKGKLLLGSSRSLRGSEGTSSVARQSSEPSSASDSGRLTRSTKKASSATGSPLQASKEGSRARKVLMASSDGETSESDDGIEEFLKEKDRPLRRSTRLVKVEGRCLSGPESE